MTKERVRTARKRSAQSTRWLQRQLDDPYVKRAKAEGYRSRAAYKLIELDEKFALLKGARRVVDPCLRTSMVLDLMYWYIIQSTVESSCSQAE